MQERWSRRTGIEFVGSKDVGNRRQSIVGLNGRNMLDLGTL